MVEDVYDYFDQKKRDPEEILLALDRLSNHYSEKVGRKSGVGIPLGPLSRFILGVVRRRLDDARAKHDELSRRFEALKPKCGAEAVRRQMAELCKEMQEVWEPFREFIGPCPDCQETRIAGSDQAEIGFGCPQCGKMIRLGPVSKK